MRYWLDTEFIEAGRDRPLQLISIGIVAEDGREFYAETRLGVDYYAGNCNEWVQENVLPHLQLQQSERRGYLFQTPPAVGPQLIIGHPDEIGDAIVMFVVGDEDPRFYAWYADYDWVVFCQLFGTMMDLPHGFPMYCRDVKQLADLLGFGELPSLPDQTEHHALDDARDCRVKWDFIRYAADGAFDRDNL